MWRHVTWIKVRRHRREEEEEGGVGREVKEEMGKEIDDRETRIRWNERKQFGKMGEAKERQNPIEEDGEREDLLLLLFPPTPSLLLLPPPSLPSPSPPCVSPPGNVLVVFEARLTAFGSFVYSLLPPSSSFLLRFLFHLIFLFLFSLMESSWSDFFFGGSFLYCGCCLRPAWGGCEEKASDKGGKERKEKRICR